MVMEGGSGEREEHEEEDLEKRQEVPMRGGRETQDLYILAMPVPQ